MLFGTKQRMRSRRASVPGWIHHFLPLRLNVRRSHVHIFFVLTTLLAFDPLECKRCWNIPCKIMDHFHLSFGCVGFDHALIAGPHRTPALSRRRSRHHLVWNICEQPFQLPSPHQPTILRLASLRHFPTRCNKSRLTPTYLRWCLWSPRVVSPPQTSLSLSLDFHLALVLPRDGPRGALAGTVSKTRRIA